MSGGQLQAPADECVDEPSCLFVAGFPASLKKGSGLDSRWDLLSMALGRYEGSADYPQIEGPAFRFRPEWGEANYAGGVDGMSGGPVFYMVNERVHLVGVQSAALPKDRYPEFVTVARTAEILRDLKCWLDDGVWPPKG